MANYESNFYLPFKGFTKPIYAIPGNHDWFDALEGFNANFLEPKAARAALAARAADLNLTSTARRKFIACLKERSAARTLWDSNAIQRGPFFELQTNDFALSRSIRAYDVPSMIATRLDHEALERARGKFTMAIVGHPKYAAGTTRARATRIRCALWHA